MKRILMILGVLLVLGTSVRSQILSTKDGFFPVDLPNYRAYGGSSVPIGGFKDFAKKGIDFGMSFNLTPVKKSRYFGWGFDVNHQLNRFEMPIGLVQLPPPGTNYSVAISEINRNWNTTTFGFGPWWLIQPQSPNGGVSAFSYEIFSKAGVSVVSPPEVRTTLTHLGNTGDLFAIAQQRKVAFGVTSGANLNFRINENLMFFINPQYVYSAANIDYTYKDLSSANINGRFNPTVALFEIPVSSGQINPSYFNLNVGVKISTGKKKEKVNDSKIVLTYPENQAVHSDSKPYTKFKWNHKGTKKGVSHRYRIEVKSLSKNPKVYVAFSPITQISFKEVFKGEQLKGKYTWNVTEMKTGKSASPFILKTIQSGLDIQLQNIACEDPAYDENGNVHYSGEILFENSANNNGTIIIDNSPFLMQNTDGTNGSIATIVGCNSVLPISLPFTLTPGLSVTACIEFTRPIGETEALVEVLYHSQSAPGVTMNEISIDSLPNCICNVCENWKFSLENNQVTQVNSSWGNMSINQHIQVSGADAIQQVKAEIVYVKHDVNDPQCYTCTKDDDNMGLFVRRGNSGKITTSPSNWEDNGIGALSDEDGDDYGNEFLWFASDDNGVNFSVPQSLNMILNLPKLNKLECCKSTFEVCIRYTLTDINCRSCDYIKCYSFEPSNENLTIEQQQDGKESN